VETYIQDTRIVRKAISGEQCDRLRDEFSEMIASVPSEALDENILFIPVDSFQKYSECIRFNWRGSIQDVLICDTYLMYLCGYLDTMYLSEKEVEGDVQKLINKMLAEECMMCKKDSAALYFALGYCSHGAYSIEDEILDESEVLSKMEQLQEWYIMAHEIGHWLFYKNTYQNSETAKKVKHGVKELICDYIEQGRTRGLDGESYQEYLDICVDEIYNEDFIIEECVCDTFAYSFVFKKAISQGYKLEDIIEAIFLLYLNLEVFSMVNLTVSEFDTYDVETSIRLIFLKYYLKEFAMTEEGYQEVLQRVYFRYEDRIMSQVLNSLEKVDEKMENLSQIETLLKPWKKEGMIRTLIQIDL
jgi:hypothetical protein